MQHGESPLFGRWDGQELEEEATALLKAAGAFRHGTGIRSPRSLREEACRTARMGEWIDGLGGDSGCPAGSVSEMWRGTETLALCAGLTVEERRVLWLARGEGCSLRETAALLGTTYNRVRSALQRALVKCERARRSFGTELPVSPGELFREEVRQKQACIYHAPPRPAARTRKGGRGAV